MSEKTWFWCLNDQGGYPWVPNQKMTEREVALDRVEGRVVPEDEWKGLAAHVAELDTERKRFKEAVDLLYEASLRVGGSDPAELPLDAFPKFVAEVTGKALYDVVRVQVRVPLESIPVTIVTSRAPSYEELEAENAKFRALLNRVADLHGHDDAAGAVLWDVVSDCMEAMGRKPAFEDERPSE